MGVSADGVRQIIYAITRVIEENKEYLTELDAAIGDNDHGINMARGFGAAAEKLEGMQDGDAAALLKATGMALISKVGGTSGPLYGTLFLKSAGVLAGKDEIGLADFAAAMNEGVQGIKARGKAELGEKTMLDVLIPVQEQLQQAANEGKSGLEAIGQAAALARERAEKTKDIQATKGRASYLGERSIGHIDPGAMSSCLMVETLAAELAGGAK